MFSRRKRVFATTGILLAILCGLLVLLFGWMDDLFQRNLQNQVLTYRNQIHHDVEDWLDAKQQLLARWVDDGDIGHQVALLPKDAGYSLDESLVRAVELTTALSPLLNDGDHIAFSIVDLRGTRLVASNPATIGQVNKHLLQGDLLTELQAGEGAYYFSQEILPARNGESDAPSGVLHVLHPVTNGGDVIAVLVLDVDVSKVLAKIFRLNPIWEHSLVYAFSERGTILASQPKGKAGTLDVLVSEPVLQYLTQIREGDRQRDDSKLNLAGFMGVMAPDVIGTWAWYNRLGLGLAIEISRDEAFALVNLFKGFAGGIAGFAALVILLFAVIQYRKGQVLATTRIEMNAVAFGPESLSFITDLQGRLQQVGQGLLALVGRNYLAGKSYLDLVPKEMALRWQAADAEVATSGEPKEFEDVLVSGGERHWLKLTKTPLRDEQGSMFAIATWVLDITALRKAEDILANMQQNVQGLVQKNTVELEQDRQRLAKIIAHAVDAIIMIDPNGVIEFANPASERLFGYAPDELMGSNIALLMEDTIAAQHNLYLDQYENTQQGSTVVGHGRQIMARNRDDHYFPVEISVGRIPAPDGSRYVGVVRDLTERQAQNETHKAFFDHSNDAYLVFVDGYVTDCNLTAVKMLGAKTKSVVVGRSMPELSPSLQPDGSLSADKYERLDRYAVVKGGECFDWMLKRIDDSSLLVEVNLTPVHVGDHNCILAVWHDISERIAAQNIIKRNEQRIHDILDSTFQLMGLLAPDGTLLEANKAAYGLVGISPESVLGRKFWDTPWWSQSREMQFKLREHVINASAGIPARFTSQHIVNDGEEVFIDFAITPVVQDDDVELIVVEGHDVTAIHEARESERRAREEAESANQAKSDFLAKMSHEIRTPMNAIIGMTRLCLNTSLTERQRQYLDSVDNAANSLMGIVNDILDFSKIEAGKLELELIPFNLRDVFANVGAVIGLKVQQKQLEFVISDLNVPMSLIGDPLRLQQVLTNLCVNAVKFTDAGHIALDVSQVSSLNRQVRLRFRVEDTGIGLSSEQQGKLFQSFTQVDASISRKYGGTGLGLTICRQLVNAMGGDIHVQSEIGKGSVFSFELPFQLDQDRLPSSPARKVSRRGAREHILVVDDNPVCWRIEEKILLNAGYRVRVAESGQQAIDWAKDRRRRIDLILMDWELPDINGVEVIGEIRKLLGDDAPPVVLVTAYGQDDVLREVDFQPQGFLSKPIASIDLLEMVDRIFRRQRRIALQPNAGAWLDVNAPVIKVPRILLVEDNEINRFLVLENLHAVGAEIECAENGKVALEMVATRTYDLVLMDLQMPVMDGFECCIGLRKSWNAQTLPVIAMTANAFSRERQKAREVGMNGFITKPFELNDLFEIMSDNLGSDFSDWKQRLLGQGGQANSVDIPAQLPGINLNDGLARINGNLSAYIQMVEEYIDQFAQVADGIELLMEQGSGDQCEMLAHKVKGVAGNLGFSEIQQLAETLERKCANADLKDLNVLLAALKTATRTVVTSAEELFKAVQDDLTDIDTVDLSRPQWCEWLLRLRDQLTLSEVVDDKYVKQLRSGLSHEANAEFVNDLCRNIENFEYADAIGKIDELLILLAPANEPVRKLP